MSDSEISDDSSISSASSNKGILSKQELQKRKHYKEALDVELSDEDELLLPEDEKDKAKKEKQATVKQLRKKRKTTKNSLIQDYSYGHADAILDYSPNSYIDKRDMEKSSFKGWELPKQQPKHPYICGAMKNEQRLYFGVKDKDFQFNMEELDEIMMPRGLFILKHEISCIKVTTGKSEKKKKEQLNDKLSTENFPMASALAHGGIKDEDKDAWKEMFAKYPCLKSLQVPNIDICPDVLGGVTSQLYVGGDHGNRGIFRFLCKKVNMDPFPWNGLPDNAKKKADFKLKLQNLFKKKGKEFHFSCFKPCKNNCFCLSVIAASVNGVNSHEYEGNPSLDFMKAVPERTLKHMQALSDAIIKCKFREYKVERISKEKDNCLHLMCLFTRTFHMTQNKKFASKYFIKGVDYQSTARAGCKGALPGLLPLCHVSVIHILSGQGTNQTIRGNKRRGYVQNMMCCCIHQLSKVGEVRRGVEFDSRITSVPWYVFHHLKIREMVTAEALFRVYVEWLAKLKPFIKHGSLPPFPEIANALIDEFIRAVFVKETASYLINGNSFQHKMKVVRHLLGLRGNEKAPQEQKQLSSNITTKIVHPEVTYYNPIEQIDRTGKLLHYTQEIALYPMREEIVEPERILKTAGDENLHLNYRHKCDAKQITNELSGFVTGGLKGWTERFYKHVHLNEVPTVPDETDQKYLNIDMMPYSPGTRTLFSAYMPAKKDQDKKEWQDGLTSALVSSNYGDMAEGDEYDVLKEVSDLLKAIKIECCRCLIEEESSNLGKETSGKSGEVNLEPANLIGEYYWHVSCHVMQGRIDRDCTYTTLPQRFGHYTLFTNQLLRSFLVKIPLDEHGVWSHYYSNSDDRQGTLVFQSHATAVLAPLSMMQMMGHITHIEGNPYLQFYITAMRKNETNDNGSIMTEDQFMVAARMGMVRDYPHLRMTTHKEGSKDPVPIDLPAEQEKKYCLVRGRDYGKQPSQNIRDLNDSLKLDDWRDVYKSRDYTAIHSLSDCSAAYS